MGSCEIPPEWGARRTAVLYDADLRLLSRILRHAMKGDSEPPLSLSEDEVDCASRKLVQFNNLARKGSP